MGRAVAERGWVRGVVESIAGVDRCRVEVSLPIPSMATESLTVMPRDDLHDEQLFIELLRCMKALTTSEVSCFAPQEERGSLLTCSRNVGRQDCDSMALGATPSRPL